MDKIVVYVEAEINPTESEEKIKKAIWNVFGDIPTQVNPGLKSGILTAQAEGLDALSTLRNLLRKDRIRDASRKPLLEGLSGNTITFYLNKQVAFAGHISFSEQEAESPLGPIKVTVKCENPRELVDWLAPRTTKN